MRNPGRTSAIAVVLWLVTAGCGARTALPGSELIEDGVGGSTSVGGQGGGGSDGVGGSARECDPETLFIYLISSDFELYRFDPSPGAQPPIVHIGGIRCPTDSSPFSMAVSRRGRAYSVFQSGELFGIDVRNANCTPTAWQPGEGGFDRFGMGFALDEDGLSESLYVAEITFGEVSRGLGRLDTETFELDHRGPFTLSFGDQIELTSAPDGALYGFFATSGQPNGTLVEIDKATGAVLEATPLPVPESGTTSLAFAHWKGDFFVFTSSDGVNTTVTRYRPADGTLETVSTLDRPIVGAGVSTCDPGGIR